MRLGVHVSIAKGLKGLIEEVKDFECETFQMFTSSPRGRSKREYKPDEIKKFKSDLAELKIKNFVVHSPYYINLASPKEKIFHSSITYALDDLKRTDMLGGSYWIVHMGSHTGSGHKEAVKRNIRGLEKMFAKDDFKAKVLIESTAGQGTQIGYKFEDIAETTSKFGKKENIGVVLDTQHTFAAGYDWSEKGGPKKILDEFDKKIGLEYLKVIHLNDSYPELGSKKDRHEHIGRGKIGVESFYELLHDSRLKDVDAIVETHSEGRKEDLKLLKELRDDSDFDIKKYSKYIR